VPYSPRLALDCEVSQIDSAEETCPASPRIAADRGKQWLRPILCEPFQDAPLHVCEDHAGYVTAARRLAQQEMQSKWSEMRSRGALGRAAPAPRPTGAVSPWSALAPPATWN